MPPHISTEERLLTLLLSPKDNREELSAVLQHVTITTQRNLLGLIRQSASVVGESVTDTIPANFDELSAADTTSLLIDVTHIISDHLAPQQSADTSGDALSQMDRRTDESGGLERNIRSRQASWQIMVGDEGREPIAMRDKHKEWLSPSAFLTAIGKARDSRDNVHRVQAVIATHLVHPQREFIIDGKRHRVGQLFAMHQNASRFYTSYINPIAIDLLLKEMGWAPKLPDDGIERVPAYAMAYRLFGGFSPRQMKLLRDKADVLLKTPDRFIAVGNNELMQISDAIEYYNHSGARDHDKGVLFFAPAIEDFLLNEFQLSKRLPDDKQDWPSVWDIEKSALSNKIRPRCKGMVKAMFEELLSQATLKLPNAQTGQPEAISSGLVMGLYRLNGKESYRCDPRVWATYLSNEKVRARAEIWKAKDWETEAGLRPLVPEDRHKNWVRVRDIVRNFGCGDNAENIKAATQIIKSRCVQGVTGFGYFKNPKGGPAFFAVDSNQIGITLKKTDIEQNRQL